MIINPIGLLSAVGSLRVTVQYSTISLTWTAPFTFNIRGVDPDIAYCVGAVNSTSSSIQLHSQCGITETEFEYPIPPDSGCHDYIVTVTPVNPAGNGITDSSRILMCRAIHSYTMSTCRMFMPCVIVK